MKNAILVGTVVLLGSGAYAWAQDTQTGSRQPTAQQGTTKTDQGSTRSDQSATKSDAGKTSRSEQKQTASKSTADEHFIMDAARGGMAEGELGKLAGDKGAKPDGKQFGKKMADDHGKANDELKSLAQSKNITLPTDIAAKDKAEHDRLSKLSGEAFDRAYMQMMVKDHQKDVNEFRQESRAGHDPEVKAWASKTLPTLEEHLKTAQSTNKVVATSGSKTGTPQGTSGTKGTSGTSGAGGNSRSGATSTQPAPAPQAGATSGQTNSGENSDNPSVNHKNTGEAAPKNR